MYQSKRDYETVVYLEQLHILFKTAWSYSISNVVYLSKRWIGLSYVQCSMEVLQTNEVIFH